MKKEEARASSFFRAVFGFDAIWPRRLQAVERTGGRFYMIFHPKRRRTMRFWAVLDDFSYKIGMRRAGRQAFCMIFRTKRCQKGGDPNLLYEKSYKPPNPLPHGTVFTFHAVRQ
jgi:hypothetical protein